VVVARVGAVVVLVEPELFGWVWGVEDPEEHPAETTATATAVIPATVLRSTVKAGASFSVTFFSSRQRAPPVGAVGPTSRRVLGGG
jgi:hypothetical protein